MRGEYKPIRYIPTQYYGSPPHAWGIRVLDATLGIKRTVHPHMCGEYVGGFFFCSVSNGSPPHAWGIPNEDRIKALTNRFTPTCVGNTLRSRVSMTSISVHPHMRGEYASESSFDDLDFGSPPHAWGIPLFPSFLQVNRRFTPTCVGNTYLVFTVCWLAPVHPHMRGEYDMPDWGLTVIAVHPHMRGEYDATTYPSCSSHGSPPHAWGILLRVVVEAVPHAVHPHMRGEYCPIPHKNC